MNKHEEEILVIKRHLLFENESKKFNGLITDRDTINHLMRNLSQHIQVMRRDEAERTALYKQPISYVIIRKKGKVFLYRRLNNGKKVNYYRNLSIGIGGHMNPTGGTDFMEVLKENIKREIEEELYIEANHQNLRIIGLVNDDRTFNDKKHFGFVGIMDLDTKAVVKTRDTDELKGKLVEIHNLNQYQTFSKLEAWSQYILQYLRNTVLA